MEHRPKATKFEDLMVWQKAHQLVLNTYRATGAYPDTERFGLISQMRRSAASVPANIAEGFGRLALGDKARFLEISQGSLQELKYFYILSRDLSYHENPKAIDACDEVGRMLTSYANQVRRSRKN